MALLNQETQALARGAQMLSGHLQGKVLQMISRMIQPKRILELGTYTGYSAIALAQGLQEGGKLHTVDVSDLWQELREKYWQEAGVRHLIEQHIGTAESVIQSLDGSFDLVFIDADKKNYGLYFDLVIDKMPAGAFIIADNVLFYAEVILPEEQQGSVAKHIHRFNQKIRNDNRVEQVILPIRDGIMLIRKK
jgi:predicted O-methyltransferase YrrM